MLSEIVIILRIAGIAFCLLHANNFYATVQQLQIEKASTQTLITEIGDHSLLLLSGALLILLSLKMQEGLQLEQESNEPDSWPLPSFYRISRPLLLVLAIAYLAIAPVTIVEAQGIRNGLVRPIDATYIRQQEQIVVMEELTRRDVPIETFSDRLESFLQLHKLSAVVLPRSISEARELLPELRRRTDLLRASKTKAATRVVRISSNRLVLQSLLQALLFLFYWLNWPRRVADVVRQAQSSMRRGIL